MTDSGVVEAVESLHMTACAKRSRDFRLECDGIAMKLRRGQIRTLTAEKYLSRAVVKALLFESPGALQTALLAAKEHEFNRVYLAVRWMLKNGLDGDGAACVLLRRLRELESGGQLELNAGGGI